MRLRRALLVTVLASGFPVALLGQSIASFHLRDLLLDLLRDGITLAPPSGNFPSHEAHFSGAESEQFHALEHMSDEIANQLSSFPLASSAGGFTYRFDPSVGAFTRTANTFGPIYAERADSIGKGKFNVGVNYSHYTFDRLHDLQLGRGDLKLVFTHADVNRDGSNLQPFFEGDVITGTLFLKVDTDITAFVMSYGVTDRLDVGLAVPVVRVSLQAQTDLEIQRLATGPVSTSIHRFLNGSSTETIAQSGSASGLGDIVLRGKYQLLRGDRGGVALAADARLPTGDDQELLGAGATRVKAFAIGSLKMGTFSPHLNLGYTWNGIHPAAGIPKFGNELNYTGGFDWGVHPRLTVAVDAIGSTYRNATILSVPQQTFQANTNPDPTAPPTIVTATFPSLTMVEDQTYTTVLGSVGAKINPFGTFLITINGLFPIKRQSLQDDFTILLGFDYSF